MASRLARTVSNAVRRQVNAVKRDDAKRLLNVQWNDGTSSKFAYAWLRDNAPEDHTYHFGKNNRARVLLMADFDPKIRPTNVNVDNGNLQIDWDGTGKFFTTYVAEWLQQRDLSSEEVAEKRTHYHKFPTKSWGSENVKSEILDKATDWERFLTDEDYMHEKLSSFLSYGLMFVHNVPKEVDQLKRLHKRLGFLLPSQYGKADDPTIFQVYAAPDPSNLHGTSRSLGLHTDFPQMTQPPEVQILHCVRSAGVGGESEFCDGFRVAELMKQEKPELYQALIKHKIEFLDWGNQNFRFQFASRWRTIELNSKGELKSIFFNNQVRSWFNECPVEEQPKLFEALKTFHEYCYEKRSQLTYKLQSGDMVWFSNNRVMHGRGKFTPDPNHGRLLEGCYMNFDLLKSTVRSIAEQSNKLDQASL